MLLRWKHQSYDNCPRCNCKNKDTNHVLRCQSEEAKITLEQETTKLKCWMENNEGNPDLIVAIMENLNAWRNNTPYPDQAFGDSLVNEAVLQQNKIGWRSALDGFLGTKWRQAQKEYLSTIGSQRKGLYWMSRLQCRIWDLVFAMWNNRNEVLHGEGNTLHQEEIRALDEEIHIEWNLGLQGLPKGEYGNLFTGTLEQTLNQNINHKRMWLVSVWLAREEQQEGTTRQINRIALDFCVWWGRKMRQEAEDLRKKEEAKEETGRTTRC